MPPRPNWLGPALAVVAAFCFATGTTVAVIAYDAGASPISVVTTRLTFTLLIVVALIRVTGAAFGLAPRDRAIALAMGLVLGIQSYAHYEAIAVLPVAIAILLLYLYPLLVGLISHAVGHERMRPVLGVALVVALVGLVLALDVTGEGLDPRGIVLGCIGATAFAVVIVVNASLIRRAGGSLPVTLHMNLSATVVFIALCVGLGEFPLPATRDGWIAFVITPVFYSAGLICFFVAVGAMGAVRASLIMNLEPVVAIVLGFALLAQVLTPLQLFGAALVVGAIVAARWNPRPEPQGD